MFDEQPDGDPHGECAAEIRCLEIALRIKTEEHQCCSEDLIKLREECREAWKEAAIGWAVCASVHEKWAKGEDALYTTRHGDFERHAEDARQRHVLLTPNEQASGAASSRSRCKRLLGAERIDMDYLHKQLFDALENMDKMHKMMMAKANHRASFYDAECLDAMNNAPILAAQAMAAYRQAFPPVVPNAKVKGGRDERN